MSIIKRVPGLLVIGTLCGLVIYIACQLIQAPWVTSDAEPAASVEVQVIEPVSSLTEQEMLFCIAQGSENFMRGQHPRIPVYGPFALTPDAWRQLVDNTGLAISLADIVEWGPAAELVKAGVSPASGYWEAGDLKVLASFYVQLYEPQVDPAMQKPSLPPGAPKGSLHLGYIMRVAQQAYGTRPLN